jgi:hypothetical protein
MPLIEIVGIRGPIPAEMRTAVRIFDAGPPNGAMADQSAERHADRTSGEDRPIFRPPMPAPHDR